MDITSRNSEMEHVKNFFDENDFFAKHCGIELLEVSLGHAKAKMPIKTEHLNGYKVVHGAAIFTLADYVFAAASNSHGNVAVAINVSISFVKPAIKGTLYAEARELSRSARLGSYTVDITDDNGDLLAVFQGLAYRKKELHEFAE